MKLYAKFVTLFAVFLLLGFVFFLSIQKLGIFTAFCPNNKPLTETVMSGMNFDVIQESIEKILDITTASYNILANYSESNDTVTNISWLPPITIGKKTYSFTVDGKIKAGFILTGKKFLEVDESAKNIIFTFPEPVITGSITDDQIIVTTETGTIFNKPDSSDYRQAVDNLKMKVEERAIESGLFSEAKRNLQDTILSFMSVIQESMDTDYTVEIQYESEQTTGL
mgnify:CR=1 FL=1